MKTYPLLAVGLASATLIYFRELNKPKRIYKNGSEPETDRRFRVKVYL